MSSRSIATLPEASRSTLRSTTILTSLPQLVFELVQNSLDAGASQVDIGVDAESWQCWVRDNGSGMDQTGMSILAKGGEEGRYGTSKAYDSASLENVSTFGFRGEALASAANLSCLEVSSRSSRSRETWSVILKGGKKLYYGPAIRWKREKPGTTVCIRDAFYNLPIRRRSHSKPPRTLELIRKDLEAVALVFPHVTFSLENSAKEKTEGSGKGRIIAIPKTRSTLSTFRHLFGRALCQHVEEIDVSTANIRIQGFISLEGAQSKSHQYLYVNRHPLSSCQLHRAIDMRFAASSFAKHAFDEAGETKTPRPTTRRSPRKNERHAIYVLNISTSGNSIDNCLEPAKSQVHFKDPDAVHNLLSTVVQDFLVRHGFASANSKARKYSGSPSPKKRQKIARDVVSSDNHVAACIPASTSTLVPYCESSTAKAGRHETGLSVNPLTNDKQEMEWIDPTTGQKYMVDSKTGNSYLVKAPPDDIDHSGTNWTSNPRTLVDTSRLKKRDPCHFSGEMVPDWMQEALQDWENPAFGLQEPNVPPLTSISSSSRRPWLHSNSVTNWPRSNPQPYYFDPKLTTGRRYNADDATGLFNKEQLRSAEVIGQVDHKFVACLVENTDGEAQTVASKTLVLIDQHAADERIRVERFLSELCRGFLDNGPSGGVETYDLEPPVPVLLTRLEARSLAGMAEYQSAFMRWGFRFTSLDEIKSREDETTGEYLQVLVEAIPDVVKEKLLLGDELRELIKGFLARLEIDGAACSNVSATDSEQHWTTALRWCPRELIDLVNSKACRGAIMFNDPLEIDQCRKLIAQLSETVWAFMCAHGRPSLAPLTNIEWSENTRRDIEWNRLEMT